MSDKAVRVENYRKKAEEVRAIAELMNDVEAKRILMSVAGDYLTLAENLERSRVGDSLSREQIGSKP